MKPSPKPPASPCRSRPAKTRAAAVRSYDPIQSRLLSCSIHYWHTCTSAASFTFFRHKPTQLSSPRHVLPRRSVHTLLYIVYLLADVTDLSKSDQTEQVFLSSVEKMEKRTRYGLLASFIMVLVNAQLRSCTQDSLCSFALDLFLPLIPFYCTCLPWLWLWLIV